MRNGQNKRMRNRNNNHSNHSNNNNRRGQNPMTRVYESNGPEIKIRGTASHLAEKYVQLARDAQGSGDPVAAENYYQHAEHYFRIIAAAQEQFRQNQPQQQQQRVEGDMRDDSGDDGEGDYSSFGAEPGFAPQPPQQQQQPYPPREPQPYQRDPQYRENRPQPQPNVQANDGDIDRLPSFITGGQPQPNVGYENGERNGEPRAERGDRFQHRRRRRHGPRPEGAAAPAQGDGPVQAGD